MVLLTVLVEELAGNVALVYALDNRGTLEFRLVASAGKTPRHIRRK
jgi:hypothetical protein